MAAQVFRSVCIESFAAVFPANQVTSAELEDRLAPAYERLGIPFGTLERLSGIKSRHFWDDTYMPSQAATEAARTALEKTSFDPAQFGALFNCSVSRDYFEPATASLVHRSLGFPERSITMDITNACIGFSDGMAMLATLIESGAVKAGLLTSAETVSRTINIAMRRMVEDTTMTRERMLRALPTLTLGSGAAAMVMCHESISKSGHRYMGYASRAASQWNELCMGNADFCFSQKEDYVPEMDTESAKLISEAAEVGARTWVDASEAWGWGVEDLDHVFCHQVGRQVNDAFYATLKLPRSKEFNIYPQYGNLVSAALPAAFMTGVEQKPIRSGEKVLLMGYGSGLNSLFSAIVW